MASLLPIITLVPKGRLAASASSIVLKVGIPSTEGLGSPSPPSLFKNLEEI